MKDRFIKNYGAMGNPILDTKTEEAFYLCGAQCRDRITELLNELSEKSDRATPIENGKNRYGVDVSYFRNLINRELNRGLKDYRPDELARVFARMAMTADSEVLKEPEFNI